MRRTPALLSLCALALGGAALAQDAEPKRRPLPPLPRTPRSTEIKALLDQLGAAEHAVREAARARLLAIGDEALPFVERATTDRDAERAFAAQGILKELRWRVPPGLKAAVGGGLDDFPTLPTDAKLQALEKIARVGHEARGGAVFLATIARLDADARVRARALELYLGLTPDGNPACDEALLEALDRETPSRAVHAQRARLLLRVGAADEALVAARKAAAGSKDRALRALLTDLLVEAGKAEEALPLLEEEEKTSQGSPDVAIRLAEAYWKLGRKAQGDELLERVLKGEPSRDLYVRIERALIEGGRPQEAREVAKRALSRFPYDRDVNVILADLDLAEGRLAEALKRYLNELRYTEPGSEPNRKIRAKLETILARDGQGGLARDELLMEDARRGRRVGAARLRLGKFLFERGLAQDAAAVLAEAAALDLESVEARLRLGDALRALGKLGDARRAFEAARALDSRDQTAGERLKELASAAPDATATAVVGSGLAVWDRRVSRDALLQDPASVSSDAVEPLLAEGRLAVVPPGVAVVLGLDAATGTVAWKAKLAPPPPPEGYALEQVGIEPIALALAPSGAIAAVEPARARDRTPFVALLANAWVRAAHQRSWKKATHHGVFVTLVDPRDGRVADRIDLGCEPLLPLAPAQDGQRLLAVTRPRQGQLELALIDLGARAVRLRCPVEGDAPRRPAFARDTLVLAFGGGVAGIGLDGNPRFALADEPSSDPVALGEKVLFGSGDRLLEIGPGATEAREVARWDGEALSGHGAAGAGLAYLASRGGPVRAVDVARGKTLWKVDLAKAAQRTVAVRRERVFVLNGGGGDVFQGERAALEVLDAQTGARVWRRAFDPPAALGGGSDTLAVVSGGIDSAAGLWVTSIRLGGGAGEGDAAARRLADLHGALELALANDEHELGALISRRLIEERGLGALELDVLVAAANAFGRSARKDEADALLGVAEARFPAAKERFAQLRASLGLVPGEEGVLRDPKAAPKPGPAPPAPGAQPGTKPGAKPPAPPPGPPGPPGPPPPADPPKPPEPDEPAPPDDGEKEPQ